MTEQETKEYFKQLWIYLLISLFLTWIVWDYFYSIFNIWVYSIEFIFLFLVFLLLSKFLGDFFFVKRKRKKKEEQH